MYVDYLYYTTVYGGTKVSETLFAPLELRASIVFENYTPTTRKLSDMWIEKDGKQATMIKITICQLIDALFQYDIDLALANKGNMANIMGIASESIKDHSVSYGSSAKAPLERLEEFYSAEYANIMKRNLLLTGLLFRGI